MNKWILPRYAGLPVLLLLAAGSAQAACSVGSGLPADFGPVSSIRVGTTAQTTSTTGAGMQCMGDLTTPMAAPDYVRVTVTTANGTLLGTSGDGLGYSLYADSSHGAQFKLTPGTPFDLVSSGVASSMGLGLGGTGKSVPLYFRTAAGANVAAGTYRETLTLAWDWSYCAEYSNGSCAVRDSGNKASLVELRMQVVNDCVITAPDISFGSAPVASGFGVINGRAIKVQCTKDSAYTVGLDEGRNPSADRRRMRSSEGNFLAYDLFKGAGATRWGGVGAARRASSDADVNPGDGTGGDQWFVYYARIYSDQANVPVGTYTDSIVIDVAF